MRTDLPPENEWFRKPKYYELIPDGDVSMFLFVAEPVKGDGVYGVCMRISRGLLYGINLPPRAIMKQLKDLALTELYARIDRGQKQGEGEMYTAFLWNPALRFVDEKIEVNLLYPDLYVRPGRFIPVEGPVNESSEGDVRPGPDGWPQLDLFVQSEGSVLPGPDCP